MSEVFQEETIRSEAEKLNKAIDTLTKEKERLEDEYAKLEQIQANNAALDECQNDMNDLNGRLMKKLREMPMGEGSFIEINPIKAKREPQYYQLPGTPRKYKINWNYSYRGTIDLKAVAQALKDYDQNGVISDIYSNLRGFKDEKHIRRGYCGRRHHG